MRDAFNNKRDGYAGQSEGSGYACGREGWDLCSKEGWDD